jgi:hypothetical protein
VEALPWVFSSGWASGINSYAVVLILGLAGRFTTVDGVPTALQRNDVLLVAGILFVVDLVADKIPYVDSTWDAIHTVIRPAIGAAIGALMAGLAGDLSTAIGATTGGVTALASHAIKAGLRAAVNTSPEPASNVVVSAGEDVSVASVVSLSLLYPWVAATIAGLLLLAGGIVVWFLASRIARFRRRRRALSTG